MKRLSLALGAVVIGGLIHTGCSGSSSGGFLPPNESANSQASASQAQTSAAIGYVSLQAALNDNDPVNYAAVQGVTVTSPSAGTIDVDFGAGTVINNTTITGVVTSTYSVSGNIMTVTTTYANVSVSTTTPAGAIVTSGSVTTTADITTPASTTGSITGSLTVVSGLDTSVVDLNLTHTLDGTNGTITLNGFADVTTGFFGVWDATFTNVNATVSATSRVINGGNIDMFSLIVPGLSVDLTFTGNNTGTLTITPSGQVEIFTL